MRIVHTDGEWFVNKGLYSFTDPETMVTFQPGEPTKAKATAWLASQPVMEKFPDPLAVKPAAKATAKIDPALKLPT